MRDDLTEVIFVLDRSGSMERCKEATIEGFNSVLNNNEKFEGEVRISLYQFDTEYEEVYSNVLIDGAPKLTKEIFEPRGMTALCDAACRTIKEVDERLRKTLEGKRPSKVIFAIITDGYENASKIYSREDLNDMITKQTEKYNWKFVFTGANQDAIVSGGSYGINTPSSCSTYIPTASGTACMYNNISDGIMKLSAVSSSEVQNTDFFATSNTLKFQEGENISILTDTGLETVKIKIDESIEKRIKKLEESNCG